MNNHPTMPAMPPTPPGPESYDVRKRHLKFTIIAVTVCGAWFAGGFFTGMAIDSDPKTQDDSRSATIADSTPEVEEETPFTDVEPEVVYPAPDVADFKITLTTKSKQCFGSAGCSVTVEPELTYPDGLDPSVTYEITYEISGDEDGPIIETAELTGESARGLESMVSTTSSSVTPKAKVTSVSEY